MFKTDVTWYNPSTDGCPDTYRDVWGIVMWGVDGVPHFDLVVTQFRQADNTWTNTDCGEIVIAWAEKTDVLNFINCDDINALIEKAVKSRGE